MDQAVSKGETMTNVLHRNPMRVPPIASSSTGRHVLHETAQRDPDRNVRSGYLDLSSGAGVTGLGHSNMRVKDAMIEQIMRMPYVHAAQWTSDVVEEAAHTITEHAGPHFRRGGATFFSGGAEAVEAACKIALQLCETVGRSKAVFITRRHSYHGGTLAALMLGDHPRRNQLSRQQTFATAFQPKFDAYCPHLVIGSNRDAHQHELASLESLSAALSEATQNECTPIVLMETVGGTTLSISPPTVSYLKGIRRLVNQHSGIIIADEILGGNFRTGHLMAWQHYQLQTKQNIAPDIVVMGKGITAGYFPMSCVLVSSEVKYILMNGGKSLWATSTNQNHPIGAAASIAAMDEYVKASPTIARLTTDVRDMMRCIETMPHVKSVQGVGLLWGVCFDPDIAGLHLKIKQQLFDQGISVYTDGGTVNGKGNMILVAPPYTFERKDIDQVIDVIGNLKLD